MNKRLLIVFLLGFSSGLPLALIGSTLQAWFASEGMSVLATGMLSLVSLPYVCRVLWGPLLDRYSLFSLGKRRSWILTMQIALLLGFNAMAWFSPSSAPKLMTACAFLIACFSATQDAAIDAHRAEYLPVVEHGLGASLASFAYRLALLTAGGLALVIAQHYGWPFTYRLMGMLMFIGVIATLWSPEPSQCLPADCTIFNAFTAPLKELFSRPGIVPLVLFILFFKLGEAFTTITSGIVIPFLIQGMGFSLETIGYVNKLLGVTAVILGGLVGGFLLLRWSLFRSLLVFGLIQAVTNVLFVILAMVGKNVPLLAIAVLCDNFAGGMGTTALVAFFMKLVTKPYTATQFSLLVAISTIPRFFSGPMGALLQMHLGWVGLYELSCLLSIGFIPFLWLLRKQMVPGSETSAAKTEQLQALGYHN